MNDEQLLRYDRHILLPEIDIAGQEALLAATVMLIGLGGLGCPAAQYLAAAGVGRLILVDSDRVELANLQRQILYGSVDIGSDKATAARHKLQRLNHSISIDALAARADSALLAQQTPACSVVLDCSDNIETRHQVNRACHDARVPLVSAAAIRWHGQLAVFRYGEGQACYQCLYPQRSQQDLACSEAGVAGPVVGLIGTLQALEAIKLIVGSGADPEGRVMLFDGLNLEWTTLALRRRADCPVCAH